MDLNVGDTVYLSQVQRIMKDEQFERLIAGESQNTTIPTMRKAQAFIVRGLLRRGTERRAFGEAKEIIGGTYEARDGLKEGRIFLLERTDKATLLWKGPLKEFRPNYRRIRDELAGPVPYRLHGRAAAKKQKAAKEKSPVFNKKATAEKEQYQPVKHAGSVEPSEKQFEDVPSLYPELTEDNLKTEGRQANVSGQAIDPLSKDKREAYNNLVRERKACRACQGLINPADYTYDSDQIGPWSLWQGNLDSDLLIVGQDWGDTRYFEKWEGRDQQTGNPTNENLQLLLEHIGICIGKPRDLQESELFFTNLILCLKKGGLQAPVEDRWFANCGERFFKPLVDIVRPRAILALGKGASTTILKLYDVGFDKNQTLKATMKNSPYPLTPSTVLFPLYHCGAGSVNRNRSIGEQKKDWQRVADWMKCDGFL